jgi:hypothetical protein
VRRTQVPARIEAEGLEEFVRRREIEDLLGLEPRDEDRSRAEWREPWQGGSALPEAGKP